MGFDDWKSNLRDHSWQLPFTVLSVFDLWSFNTQDKCSRSPVTRYSMVSKQLIQWVWPCCFKMLSYCILIDYWMTDELLIRHLRPSYEGTQLLIHNSFSIPLLPELTARGSKMKWGVPQCRNFEDHLQTHLRLSLAQWLSLAGVCLDWCRV